MKFTLNFKYDPNRVYNYCNTFDIDQMGYKLVLER